MKGSSWKPSKMKELMEEGPMKREEPVKREGPMRVGPIKREQRRHNCQ